MNFIPSEQLVLGIAEQPKKPTAYEISQAQIRLSSLLNRIFCNVAYSRLLEDQTELLIIQNGSFTEEIEEMLRARIAIPEESNFIIALAQELLSFAGTHPLRSSRVHPIIRIEREDKNAKLILNPDAKPTQDPPLVPHAIVIDGAAS